MKTLGFRIEKARKTNNFSKAQVADALKISRSAITQWETGATTDMKCRFFFPLAKLLNVDPMELYTGEPSVNGEMSKSDLKFVPLLEWSEIENLSMKDDNTEWIPTTVLTGHGFALKMTSDSMISLGSPFPQNSTVIFDSEKQWESGDFVIAKTSEGPVFRQIMQDGNTTVLKPLNQQYPIIQLSSEVDVVGVAVETLTQI